MTRVTILGRLTAAEDRTLRGTLLPFGVPGLTNLGRVTAARGDVTIPEDVTTLRATLDHNDDRDTVATFDSIEETDGALLASWTVPRTHGGDRLLEEFRAGIRTGVSVELEPVTIRDGRITAARVDGCAFPIEPAFPTARLVASLAPDTTDDPETPDPAEESDTDDAPASEETPAGPGDPEGEPTVTTPSQATAAGQLTAADATPNHNRRLTASTMRTSSEFFRLMAEAHRAGDRRLLAALTDVIPSNLADAEQPQWVGELWSGTPYQRRIVPLLAQSTLTGLKAKGWRWTTKPVVDRYAGDKAAVPSGPVATEPVEKDAQRFAGAHDIDRKYRDFNDTAFWQSYYAAMSESYARQTDLYAAEEVKAGATAVTPGPVPAGVSAAWAAIVDAALAVVDIGTPSFALVEKSVYRELILTPTDQFLEFLSAQLGMDQGNLATFKIVPVSSTAVGTASAAGLDRGEIVVGTRAAASWHELGGGAPIRVEAVDMVNGGIDTGVFGYGEVIVHDPRGLAIVDLTADV